MPTYVYKIKDGEKGCEYCRDKFEIVQKMTDKPLEKCPRCGSAVRRVITNVSMGPSKSGFDRRAKEKGFHKLEKRDKGTYEKLY